MGTRGLCCVLAAAVVLGACSDDGPGKPDAGADALVDGLVGDGGTSPGCTPACKQGQVCHKGACTTPGPTRSCGTTTYGTGPFAGKVLHVNGAYTGSSSDGSQAKPFKTIAAALAAVPTTSSAAPDGGVPADHTVAVAAGTYEEQLVIDRKVTLRCRCPQQVRITGPVKVHHATSDLEVTIDGCEIAPKALTAQPQSWGTCVTSSKTSCSGAGQCTAPETCDLTKSVCVHPQEDANWGLRVLGGPGNTIELVLRDSVVAGWCTGIYFNAEPTSTSSLCVTRTRSWANYKGLEVLSAPVTRLSPSAACGGLSEGVATTLSRVDQNEYIGLYTHKSAQGVGLRANLVERTGTLGSKTSTAGGFGVYLWDITTARVESNVIRDNEHVGLTMYNNKTLVKTDHNIVDNVLSGNRVAGLALLQLQADKEVQITGNRVTDTRTSSAKNGGNGMHVCVNGKTSFAVKIRDNVVTGSKRNGMFLGGVSGSVDNNTVASSSGYALFLQQAASLKVGANIYSGNAKGKIYTTSSPVELCGIVPIPIP